MRAMNCASCRACHTPRTRTCSTSSVFPVGMLTVHARVSGPDSPRHPGHLGFPQQRYNGHDQGLDPAGDCSGASWSALLLFLLAVALASLHASILLCASLCHSALCSLLSALHPTPPLLQRLRTRCCLFPTPESRSFLTKRTTCSATRQPPQG
eukprot:3113856-Rhodomonas_salina.4